MLYFLDFYPSSMLCFLDFYLLPKQLFQFPRLLRKQLFRFPRLLPKQLFRFPRLDPSKDCVVKQGLCGRLFLLFPSVRAVVCAGQCSLSKLERSHCCFWWDYNLQPPKHQSNVRLHNQPPPPSPSVSCLCTNNNKPMLFASRVNFPEKIIQVFDTFGFPLYKYILCGNICLNMG